MPQVRLAVVLALVAACGRIGFDDQADAPNGGPDSVMFVEPMGRLDPTFGTGGQTIAGVGGTEHAQDILPRAGGGYLVGGFRMQSVTATFALIAFTADGIVDPTYGTSGYAFPTINNDDFGYGLAARPDGTTLIVGDGGVTAEDDIVVSMVDDRGTLVTGYGTNGFRSVNSAPGFGDSSRRAVQDGDTTYVCGTIRYDQPSSEVAILALDSLGMGVPSFDTDGVVFQPLTPTNNHCADLLVDRSGQVVITGKTGNGAMIARFRTDGGLDPSFNGSGFVSVGSSGYAYGIALATNNDLVIAGEDNGDGIIVRRSATGAPAAFGTAGAVTIALTPLLDVVIQPNGKIIVAGERPANGPGTDMVIMRRNADGTPDPSFGAAGELVIDVSTNDRIRALRQDADGKILVVGYVDQLGAERPWIARIE